MDHHVHKDISNDPPLGPFGEDTLELIKELTEKCTKLESKVLDLQQLTQEQGKQINLLTLRVQILTDKKKSRTKSSKSYKRLKKVGTTQRISSYEEDISLGEDAPK